MLNGILKRLPVRNRRFFNLELLVAMIVTVACSGGKTEKEPRDDEPLIVTDVDSDSLSGDDVADLPLMPKEGGERVDELFDDFLYTFVRSHRIQDTRTEQGLNCDLSFMAGEYCTNLYSSQSEMGLNEDTMLSVASVERIDLREQEITSFKFHKQKGKWRLTSKEVYGFAGSDMCDFLQFYARFTTDSVFQYKSMSRSIRVTMMDPDDENQSIEGFIDREQWPTVIGDFPSGVISNIRYGQIYDGRKRMMLEKMAMGQGMSETFTFEKHGKDWKLTQFDN